MGLSTKNIVVVEDTSIGKVEIGDILKINSSEFRTVASIDEIDTTNIHDIFGDGSCKATYRLNGDGNDLSGLFNGTLVNTTFGLDGKYGKEVEFRTTRDNRFSIPNILDFFNVSFSVSYMIKNIDALTGILFTNGLNSGSDGNASGWGIGSSFYIYRSANNTNATSRGIALSKAADLLTKKINQLSHVVLSYNHTNGVVSVSIDGVFVESGILDNYAIRTSILYSPPSYPTSAPICTFGCGYLPGYPGTAYHYKVNANLSQIRIFNKVLTADEVLKLYSEKRYLIPVAPELTAIPNRVETVSSIENISNDTFFNTVNTKYDYKVINTVTEVSYLANKKIKYQSSIYKTLKEVPIGISLTNKEYFELITGISLLDNILAYSNGKDEKNYLVTEIESVKDLILENTDTNVNGYRYLAKYKNLESILLEEKEPVFTGEYTPTDYNDIRVVLKGNKWYRNIPNSTSILKNTDFNGLTDWQYGYRTTGNGTYLEGASVPAMVIAENNTLSLGSKPNTLYNGFVQQKLDIPKAGFYNLSLEVIRQDPKSGLVIRIINTANGAINLNGNTLTADEGRHLWSIEEFVGVSSKRVWLTPSDRYLNLVNSTVSALETKSIIKNLKLTPDTSSTIELSPLSFLAKILFKDGIPVSIDDKWTPPKVMQEDTLINGKLTTTGNRVWMEIGTVYIDQRLVIDNPFGNENWKDCDVKAYILHPVTKRWEGCHPIVSIYEVILSYGLFIGVTSEGVILQTAKNIVYGNDVSIFGGTAPFLTAVEADMGSGRVALSISYQPESITI